MTKESIVVLQQAIELQLQKANDYQNPHSSIQQADYYPRGCASILDIMNAKMLRIKSVMEAMENDTTYQTNFESLEDSAIDLINYASFFVEYARGKMQGQHTDRNFLNKKSK